MESPSDTTVVVAAAVLADGRVLAARRVPRTSPPWELPGGKVLPGEDPARAVEREVAEELGCRVRVTGRLDGEQPLDGGRVLRAYAAHLVEGEPQPREHDTLRWLGPEELDEVDWLDADREFLPQLRERLLDGEPLPGGNVGGAVRVGGTVRRPAGPWSPAVHALLRHLAAAGLDGVPRVLGYDERGREVLTYLPGRTLADGQAPDRVLVQTMRWLRRYHAAVRGFRPTGALRWRFSTEEIGPDRIVCHHDVAPYNVVVDGRERLVGVIDWDVAGPARPLDDLAFAAWNFVPLWRDIGVEESVRRLVLLCSAYGDADPREVLAGVVPRIARATQTIRAGQEAGDPGMVHLASVGEPARTEHALDGLRRRIPRIGAQLGP